ncbi:MAG: hypothetical protein ACYTG0_30460 [Planctomycetota bacterium]|jgi:hypothetical protein
MFTSILLAASVVVGAEKEVNVPKAALDYLAYLRGNWSAEGGSDEDTWKAKYSYRLAPGKHCVIFNGHFDSVLEGRSPGSGIIGWDSSKQQVVHAEFWASGFSHTYYLTIKSPTLLEGNATGTDPEGKVFVQKLVKVEKKGEDEFTWSGSGITRGGEDEPDYVLRFSRIAKKPKSRKK